MTEKAAEHTSIQPRLISDGIRERRVTKEQNTFKPNMIVDILSLSTLVSLVVASSRFVDDSYLMRNKRQNMYYLCGTFPNQYYSSTPCPSANMCPNGGTYLNVGCTNSAQCTPYHRGVSTCINNCCCTVPIATTVLPPNGNRFGYCPSGQLSEVRCSGRNQCPSGHVCMTGLCCTVTGNEFEQACGGLLALSSCTNGGCNTGVCTASNYCCECPVGRSGGVCNNGICGNGYSCVNGYCCPQCPNNAMPFGSCRQGICGAGRTCHAGNICC